MENGTRDAVIFVRVTAAERAALQAIAEAQGATATSLTRLLIRRELERRAPQEEAKA